MFKSTQQEWSCRTPSQMPGNESNSLGFNASQQLQWKPLTYIENSGRSQHNKSYRSGDSPSTQDQSRSNVEEARLIQLTIIFFTIFPNMASNLVFRFVTGQDISLFQSSLKATS